MNSKFEEGISLLKKGFSEILEGFSVKEEEENPSPEEILERAKAALKENPNISREELDDILYGRTKKTNEEVESGESIEEKLKDIMNRGTEQWKKAIEMSKFYYSKKGEVSEVTKELFSDIIEAGRKFNESLKERLDNGGETA